MHVHVVAHAMHLAVAKASAREESESASNSASRPCASEAISPQRDSHGGRPHSRARARLQTDRHSGVRWGALCEVAEARAHADY